MSGRIVSPKTWDLSDGNLGLFWAVSGLISDCYWSICVVCVLNCDWSVWGRNGLEFSVLSSGTECWKFWVVLDSPHTVFGLLKQLGLMVGLKLSMCVVCKILLRVNGLKCVRKQIVNAYNLMC